MWWQIDGKIEKGHGRFTVSDSAEKMNYPEFEGTQKDPGDTVPFNFEREIADLPIVREEEPADEGVELTQQVDWNRNWELPESLPTLTQHEPLVKKRNNVAKRAILLTSGMAIGMSLAVSLLQDDSKSTDSLAGSFVTEAATTAESSDAITVSAKDTGTEKLMGDAEYVRSVAPPKSGAAEFAINQPFKIGIRDYLYLKNSGRFYGSEFNASQSDVSPQSLKVTAPVLKKVPGDEGRFQPRSSNLQWQGGFRMEDSENNVKLGAAYQDYLKKTLGSGEFESLSSFQRESTDLLSQIDRGPTGIGLRKHK
jgi:hypothetical protein